jgi:hypothetical protein
VYTLIGACALEVDHGAKSPEKVPFIEHFQTLGPDLPKAEFKRLQTDMNNFIKREIIIDTVNCCIHGTDHQMRTKLFFATAPNQARRNGRYMSLQTTSKSDCLFNEIMAVISISADEPSAV